LNTPSGHASAVRRKQHGALHQVGLFSLFFVMFAYTTGGPYGLEGSVPTSGPGLTLLYILVLPFFWAIPTALVAAELTTAMPVEGGFYRWVGAAFGDFWGFQAGWWNWMSSFLLMSSYAVLFADYVTFYFPALTGWRHYLVALALTALVAWVNIRGIRLVGAVSAVLTAVVLVPVVAMCVVAVPQWRHNPFLPWIAPGHAPLEVLGVGLALVLWGYSGYEQTSSCAEEVREPQRNFPISLALTVPVSVATYFFPVALSLAVLGNWQDWNSRYFVDAARAIGGPWIGLAMFLSAAVCNVSLLNSTVLTGTRIPFAMAEDGYLPRPLAGLHQRHGTPVASIVVSSVLCALFAVQTLAQIISVYIWLRIGVTVLMVLACWRLRRTRPELPRTFRIPWGRAGLLYAVGAPVVMAGVSLLGSDPFALRWGPVALLLGPLAYALVRGLRLTDPS
jgi:amino acid transporter